jgi:ribosomal protein L11 methyltransferase
MPAFFMKEYLEIEIPTGDLNQSEILIAFLSDIGFQGMEETATGIKAYAEFAEVSLEQLASLLEPMGLTFTVERLREQNWNSTWESNFEPVIIPGKICIRADFHPILEGFEHVIEITPKMSFGTGHHSTTRMMMLDMMEFDFSGKEVFDFGTGTGVLAILAKKLGASRVIAIDNDQWSIENAKENFLRNDCDDIELHLSAQLNHIPQADIILANINKHVLMEQAEPMRKLLKNNGILLISGLLSNDYDDIISLYSPLFGSVISRKTDKDWIALRFERA